MYLNEETPCPSHPGCQGLQRMCHLHCKHSCLRQCQTAVYSVQEQVRECLGPLQHSRLHKSIWKCLDSKRSATSMFTLHLFNRHVIVIVITNQDSTSSRLLPGSSYSCCIRNHMLAIMQADLFRAHPYDIKVITSMFANVQHYANFYLCRCTTVQDVGATFAYGN
jgi:hypothetical protein